jgi:hypothetical protein
MHIIASYSSSSYGWILRSGWAFFLGIIFPPKKIFFLKYLDHQISKLPNFTPGSKKLPTK